MSKYSYEFKTTESFVPSLNTMDTSAHIFRAPFITVLYSLLVLIIFHHL